MKRFFSGFARVILARELCHHHHGVVVIVFGVVDAPFVGEDGRPWNAPKTILGQRVVWERHVDVHGRVAYER